MNQTTTITFILFGAIITFVRGGYGTFYRSSTVVLSNELSMYAGMSLITLFPFVLLVSWTEKFNDVNLFIAITGIVIGVIGAYIYFSDMVLSKDPSWGLSLVIAPVLQFLCLAVVRVILALTHPSSGTR